MTSGLDDVRVPNATAPMQQPMLFDFTPYITLTQPDAGRECVGRVLHLGAGVQSSCLVEMISEGDLPLVDLVIFADTGNEPPWVYQQVAYLKTRLQKTQGIPLVKVQNGIGIIAGAQAASRRFVSMPLFTRDSTTGKVGMLRRQCTHEYKIKPARDFILNWLIQRGYGKFSSDGRRIVSQGIYIHNIFGISLDEFERMGRNRGAAWEIASYPLIARKMTRQSCIMWLRNRNLPLPQKSACVVCPFHSDAYWLSLAKHYSDTFEEACRFDDWLRIPDTLKKTKHPCFLHRSCQPLREVTFGTSKASIICGDHCHT